MRSGDKQHMMTVLEQHIRDGINITPSEAMTADAGEEG